MVVVFSLTTYQDVTVSHTAYQNSCSRKCTSIIISTSQVYLKAVAKRLKKIQCSARTNNFKNTIKQTHYKNIQQIVQCSQIVQSEQHLASDNHYRHQYRSIYSAVSDILFILLLIFSTVTWCCSPVYQCTDNSGLSNYWLTALEQEPRTTANALVSLHLATECNNMGALPYLTFGVDVTHRQHPVLRQPGGSTVLPR